jgi:5'-nucleotidase/UDP-sugar diphosphatase
VERHPEWRVAFVGLGHCHRRSRAEAAGAAVMMPGWRLDTYARVRLAIDPARPSRERVTSVDAELVDVRLRDGLSPDPGIAALRETARRDLDAALGATIGFSATGMDDDSEAMGRWITRALREELRVDVAVNNTSSIRQSLAKGPITKASVHSILPFENEVYTVKITGAALARLVAERAFVVAGATRVEVPGKTTKSGKPAHEVRLDGGALVDPAKTYTVALTDFLYDVGKHFDFKAADPSPRHTGVDWRAPIIAWTTRLATTDKSPLEAKLGGSTKPPPRKKKPKK